MVVATKWWSRKHSTLGKLERVDGRLAKEEKMDEAL